jgi:hypothetical protein
MKSITRLSLVLIMFSLFSISYLVTSVSAQMRSPDMGAPGMGAPSSVSANPDTVCIPESAKDQTRKFGYKCMTPETIDSLTTRAEKGCRERTIKGHGKFRAGKNDKRAGKQANPMTMQQEIIERTSFCVEKKSLLHCEDRVNSGLHIDDEFCFPKAERFCGGTKEIRIKTDGTEIPYGRFVKWFPDLCDHYEIVPIQKAAIKILRENKKGLGDKRGRGTTKEERKARKRAQQ